MRHDWVVVAAFRPDRNMLRSHLEQMAAGDAPEGVTIELNETVLVHEPQVGCFVCERPYEPGEYDADDCPGDPKDRKKIAWGAW